MPLPKSIRRSIGKQASHVLETGNRFRRFDQLRQRHFWSSYYFIPDANGYVASGTFPVFTTPVGSNGQGFPSGVVLTDRESNWKSQNRVPDNQNFEITEIGVSLGMVTPEIFFIGSDPQDISTSLPIFYGVPPRVMNQFLNNTIVSITYLTNSVPLGMVADFAQASAPHLGAAIAANPEGQPAMFRSNGFPSPALRRRFKIPILLQHGETFSFSFEIPRSFWIGRILEGGPPADTPTNISPVVMRLDFWATESFVEKS